MRYREPSHHKYRSVMESLKRRRTETITNHPLTYLWHEYAALNARYWELVDRIERAKGALADE